MVRHWLVDICGTMVCASNEVENGMTVVSGPLGRVCEVGSEEREGIEKQGVDWFVQIVCAVVFDLLPLLFPSG